jgi:hypothetical protein
MVAKKYITPGMVFNRLTFVRFVENPVLAEFLCSCGTEKTMHFANVTSGKSKSCGCFSDEMRRKISTTHGMSKTPTYKSWTHMRERCFNPGDKRFKHYGGRGITVCPEWKNDFSIFLRDMGVKPEKMTLDRIDNNGNYEPGNCRWASNKEQSNNRSNNTFVKFNGEHVRIREVASKFGLTYGGMRHRIHSKTYSKEIFSTEKEKTVLLECEGLSLTLKEWEKKTGVARGTIYTRIRRGKTGADVISPVKPSIANR